MLDKKYISIGKISKPVGLKGYVKVLSLTDFPERFKSLKSIKLLNHKENEVLINKFSNSEDFFIEDVIYEKEFFKILFNNYNDINSVSDLIGCFLIIDESERIKLENGRYYYDELIGMDVKYNDSIIGKTIAIENYGGHDLFKIKLRKDNNHVLIPYVDDFIKKIDLKNKYIEIDVIDGMLN